MGWCQSAYCILTKALGKEKCVKRKAKGQFIAYETILPPPRSFVGVLLWRLGSQCQHHAFLPLKEFLLMSPMCQPHKGNCPLCSVPSWQPSGLCPSLGAQHETDVELLVQVQVDLISAFHYLKGAYRQAGDCLFCRRHQ